MSNNRVEITWATTNIHDITADVDFTVADSGIELAEAVYSAVLERCDGKLLLKAGKYNIRLLCVVTEET